MLVSRLTIKHPLDELEVLYRHTVRGSGFTSSVPMRLIIVVFLLAKRLDNYWSDCHDI